MVKVAHVYALLGLFWGSTKAQSAFDISASPRIFGISPFIGSFFNLAHLQLASSLVHHSTSPAHTFYLCNFIIVISGIYQSKSWFQTLLGPCRLCLPLGSRSTPLCSQPRRRRTLSATNQHLPIAPIIHLPKSLHRIYAITILITTLRKWLLEVVDQLNKGAASPLDFIWMMLICNCNCNCN